MCPQKPVVIDHPILLANVLPKMAEHASSSQSDVQATNHSRRSSSQPQVYASASRPLSNQRERLSLNHAGAPREEEAQLEAIEKVSTGSSSSSSCTRYESSEHRFGKKRSVSSGVEDSLGQEDSDFDPAPLERRATRPEIDDEGRRELSRIFTTASQKIDRQISIAQPGDPAVDPRSDAFDLTKFLKTFRHLIEGEGVELKKLSVVYKGLNVYGSGKALQLQSTVADIFMAPFRAREYLSFGKKDRKQILHSFDGIIKQGELCVVLGRPGSGCSTLLKALTGELHGLQTDESVIHYNGIPQQKMIKEFKGETVYNQEVDKHFPHLTVGQTLEFASVSANIRRAS